MKWISTVFLLVGSHLSANTLPSDWYLIPEDRGEVTITQSFDTQTLRKGLDRILVVNHNAFDELATTQDLLVSTYREKKWKLTKLQVSLGVSGAGSLGILVAKGSVGVELWYRKKTDVATPKPPPPAPTDIFVVDGMATDDMHDQLEGVIAATMASGEVADEDKFRTELYRTADQFYGMMAGLSYGYASRWWVKNVVLELKVGVSGTVSPGIAIGGGVRLRLYWVPQANPQYTPPLTAQQKNLHQLVRVLAAQANNLPEKQLEAHRYDLKELRFGLGFFAEVEVGVVDLDFAIAGLINLKKRSTLQIEREGHPPPLITANTITYLSYNSKPRHLRYARRNRIPYTVLDGTNQNPKVVKFGLVADRFQKGLTRSLNISEFFLERAKAKEHKRKWEIYKVKPEFALSLSAGFSMVTIGGKAAMRLTYEKRRES